VPVSSPVPHSRRIRWYAKKTSRTGMAAIAGGLGRWRPGNNAATGIRVLTYHRFGPSLRDPFCVEVGDFDAQMAWVAKNGLALTLEEIEAYLAGDPDTRREGVLVTIDDGFKSLLTAAVPVLARHRIPAVAFIPVGKVGGDEDGSEPHLTWAELAIVAQAGVTIGSHSWSHRSFARLPRERMQEEAVRSREVLEDRLGSRISAFAYPFGTRADYSREAAAVLEASGYACAFTSQHEALRPGMHRFMLPRIKIEGGEGLATFRRVCRGGLDAWSWVDRRLSFLQERGQ